MTDYPSAVTTRLKPAVNNLTFTLSTAVGIGDGTVYVTATTGAPSAGSFHIENEVHYYTGKASDRFTGVLKGQDGTADASHEKVAGGNEVVFGPEAHHINNLNEEMVAVQTELGKDLDNVIRQDLADAKGDMILGSEDDAWVRKAIGSTGEILVVSDGTLVYANPGWIPSSDTWAFNSATEITVPSGAPSRYSVGMKIKYTQSTGGTKYAYIATVADTLLTINDGDLYTLEDEAITLPYYSSQATPLNFPIIMIPGYVKARIYLSPDQDNITNDTWIKILLNAISFDSGSIVDLGNNKIVTPVIATYRITGQVVFENSDVVADKEYNSGIFVDGANVSTGYVHSSINDRLGSNTFFLGKINKDVDIELYVRQRSGTSTVDIEGNVVQTYIEVELVSIL